MAAGQSLLLSLALSSQTRYFCDMTQTNLTSSEFLSGTLQFPASNLTFSAPISQLKPLTNEGESEELTQHQPNCGTVHTNPCSCRPTCKEDEDLQALHESPIL